MDRVKRNRGAMGALPFIASLFLFDIFYISWIYKSIVSKSLIKI